MNIRNTVAIGLVSLSLSCVLVGCHGGNGGSSANAPRARAADNPWFLAASTGTQTDLDAALRSGSSPNVQESHDRNTPLHVAAMAGNVNAVKFIVANGGNIDGLDEDGRSALMMGLFRSQGATTLALVEAGANLEIRDREGKTALMFAAQYGQVDTIRAMITRKVNLDAQSRKGTTALIFAADRGQLEVAKVLKAAGANTTLRDNGGRSALDFAIRKNHPEIVNVLRGG